MNEGIREYARRQPWAGLEDIITLTTNGTKYLTLPHFVDTVVWLLNKTDIRPVRKTGDWDREATSIYSQGTTGAVINYDDIGDVSTLRDPTGYVWFQSSHASDLQTIFVTGYVNNSGASGSGLERSLKTESFVATGTAAATLANRYVNILSVSKATDANGDFFFYDAGASNAHISFLGRYDDDARFKRLQLLYVPDSQKIFELKFRYKVPKLVNDSQSPHPNVKADFLIEYAIARHLEEQKVYTQAQARDVRARNILEAEANKDQNFNEPFSQIIPFKDDFYDVDSGFYSYWY